MGRMATTDERSDLEAVVLTVVRDLVRELHSEVMAERVRLDSSLERDLALDSLAVAELRARVEAAADVELPDVVVGRADSPRDLLRAARGDRIGDGAEDVGGRGSRPAGEGPTPILEAPPPEEARTVMDLLSWPAASRPDETCFMVEGDRGGQEVTYRALHDRAHAVARGLRHRGVEPDDRVALMLPTSPEYFEAFAGILLAGAVPVPLYPPARLTHIEEHLQRQVRILDNARAVILVTVPEAGRVASLLRPRVASLREVATVAELSTPGPDPVWVPRRGEDTALIQYTSGSTGDPKGVVLSHHNILANIRAIGSAIRLGPDDVAVSWLPLYHDMGLIGVWMTAMAHGIRTVFLSPLAFLGRPVRWLQAITAHGGTVSVSPNFGYELCVRRIPDRELEGIDLRTWRIAMNGAEPVSADTIRRFSERFGPRGFRSEAMMPVYGLAECAVALTFAPSGRDPRVDRIDREILQRTGRAEPATRDAGVLSVVSSGVPLPGHHVRVVDEGGTELPERRQGRIQFRGPSAISGYHRNREATRELIRGEWLETGDLGYLADGELHISGRQKDLIIRAGRNLHPQDVEEAAGRVEGIRAGRVAAFASALEGGERFVVVAESRATEPRARERLSEEVGRAVVRATGVLPDDVAIAPPGAVPITSSGKLRRSACRDLYERGSLGQRRSPWRQLTRLTAAAAWTALARGLRGAARALYAGYVWLLLVVLGLPTWLLTWALPAASWRYGAFRLAGRLLLLLAGVRVRVEGRSRLTGSGGAVVAANHGSFLDGLVLTTVLPRRLVFVAAREFSRRPHSGPFLWGIGARFVERDDPGRGVADVEELVAVARRHAVVLFPEGTMSRGPGLRPLRTGAFLVAARAEVPLVPVGIRGTRAMLPPGRYGVRPGRVEVIVEEPIRAAGASWSDAIALRRDARTALLRASGEPDIEPA
jgi:1-acyl-sn-glycerol-3-phosphate acyltransferase